MLAILPMLLLAACGPPHLATLPAAPSAPAAGRPGEERVELSAGATAPVRDADATVTFVRVEDDSRCPEGVTCVWEGDATVELHVARPGRPDAILRLHAMPGPSQSGTVEGLRVTLERLEPRPTADASVPASAYRVTLLLSPAGGRAMAGGKLK